MAFLSTNIKLGAMNKEKFPVYNCCAFIYAHHILHLQYLHLPQYWTELTIKLDEDVRDDKWDADRHGIHKRLQNPASRMPRITSFMELASSKCCGKHHPEKYLNIFLRK
jgi:hypothetical protein